MIGLQNIEITKIEETDRGIFWNTLFKNTFDEKEYVCITYKQTFGFFITCWVLKSIFEHVSNVKIEKSKKGFGLCLHLSLGESKLCFINSHFFDQQIKFKKSSSHYQEILEAMCLGDIKSLENYK